MKKSTFEKRTSSARKNSNGYKQAVECLTNGVARTCHTSGSGRFTTNIDRTQDTAIVLEMAGLIEDVDFTVENDSLRGGKTGNYIQLTANGKRKMIS